MAAAVDSQTFTIAEMQAGTAPSAWYVALGVTTLHALTTTPVGTKVMITVAWE